jgi:hypothetical protein
MIPGLTPPLMQIMSHMAGKNQLLLRMAPRNVAVP